MQHVWNASSQPHFCRLERKMLLWEQNLLSTQSAEARGVFFFLNNEVVYICTSLNQSTQDREQSFSQPNSGKIWLVHCQKNPYKLLRDGRLPSYCRTWTDSKTNWQINPIWQGNQGKKWVWNCSNLTKSCSGRESLKRSSKNLEEE